MTQPSSRAAWWRPSPTSVRLILGFMAPIVLFAAASILSMRNMEHLVAATDTIRRLQDGRVEALNVVCPHNGCFVGYDAAQKIFSCPCHKDTFDLSGTRLKEDSLSLRDLDALEVDQAKLAAGEVWVKFQNFRTNTAEKVPQA